jgi:hypothetical protein
MPEQPRGRTDDDAPSAAACGHDFVVGQTVAVIGKVVRVWPQEQGLPPALQVRFTNFVQKEGGMFTPVPASIVRASSEDP